MRMAIALHSAAAVVLAPALAGALETAADVETDHVSAADDEGPRSVGFTIDALAMSGGWVGGEIDAALLEKLVVTAGVAGNVAEPAPDLRVRAGLEWFPLCFAFRGFFLAPRIEWVSPAVDPLAARLLAGAALAGYEWTWQAGATVRVGAGAGYATRLSGSRRPVGLEPRFDVSLGWVF